jgi:hypothetical protein
LVANVLRRPAVPEQQQQSEEFERHHRRGLLLIVAADSDRPAVGAGADDGVSGLPESGAAVGLLPSLELKPERPPAGSEDVGLLGGSASRLREASLRLDADLLAQPHGYLALESVALRSARFSAHPRTFAPCVAVVTR